MVSFLNVFLMLTSLVVVCLSRETGLVQLTRQSTENPYVCSQSLPVFICTTSGRGETSLSISSVAGDPYILRFRHSTYENGGTIPEERFDSDLIAAVNLSRSIDKECFDRRRVNNVTDFCYTTTFIVRLTDRTICGTVSCSTIYNNGTSDIPLHFGNTTITTMPPAPANLRVINQTPVQENVTFTWDPVTKNCSNIHYSVTILNCGSCRPTTNTNDNRITCKDLVPGQKCSISIQAVQKCGVSETVTLGVLIGGTPTSAPVHKGTLNIGAITGGVIALLVLLIVLLLLTVTIMTVVYVKKIKPFLLSRQHPRNSNSSHPDSDGMQIGELLNSLDHAHAEAENADKKLDEAMKKEAAAHTDTEQARNEANRSHINVYKIEAQVNSHRAATNPTSIQESKKKVPVTKTLSCT